MVPLVSDRYKYILFYNPKSACSVARQLFLRLHKEELSDAQRTDLELLKNANQDEWHDVNKLFPLSVRKASDIKDYEKYADYYKFTLVRHPVTRFISAYLNRIVLQQTDLDKIRGFLLEKHGDDFEVGYSFKQFLEYFDQSETDNAHFLPQSNIKGSLSAFSLISPFVESTSNSGVVGALKRCLLPRPTTKVIRLDDVCRVESLSSDFLRVYGEIFAKHPEKLVQANELITSLPYHNVTFSGNHYNDAANLSAEELRQMDRMPAYTCFVNAGVEKILSRHFDQDFRLFGYSKSIDGEVANFEQKKTEHLDDVLPQGFEWRRYLAANADLGANGINTRLGAVSHWIHHGQFENRKY